MTKSCINRKILPYNGRSRKKVIIGLAAGRFLMVDRRRELGKMGEEIAARELERRGFSILNRNFRCRLGEIDIIAGKDDRLLFVEVKTNTSAWYGLPQEKVDWRKRAKIKNIALFYLTQVKGFTSIVGFWVIAVQLKHDGQLRELSVIEDAFV